MAREIGDINDVAQWSKFVAKLCDDTNEKRLLWEESQSFRPDMVGHLYVTYVGGKAIGVYRYRYGEDDEYSTISRVTEDVAIEMVNNDGDRLWTLPQIAERFRLIDLIEYNAAGAEEMLKNYLNIQE